MNAWLQEKRQAVTFSEKHDGLTPLALAVREQCSAETVAVLLAAGASPVSLMDASPDIPESINGVRQARYKRSALGIALLGKVRNSHVGSLTDSFVSRPQLASLPSFYLTGLHLWG